MPSRKAAVLQYVFQDKQDHFMQFAAFTVGRYLNGSATVSKRCQKSGA